MNFLQTLTKLSRIVKLIRDPEFRATQPAIGADLGMTDRTVRTYFDILTELDAPLINHGRMGWELVDGWDLSAAMREYCE
jgi:hypothetical protein